MSEPVRIQRKRTKGWKMPANTVYVGRPSIFGNPYRIQYDNDRFPGYRGFAVYDSQTLLRGYYMTSDEARKVAVEEFRGYMKTFNYKLDRLRGKNLCCWCSPNQPCHADILLELANSPPRPNQKDRRG